MRGAQSGIEKNEFNGYGGGGQSSIFYYIIKVFKSVSQHVQMQFKGYSISTGTIHVGLLVRIRNQEQVRERESVCWD